MSDMQESVPGVLKDMTHEDLIEMVGLLQDRVLELTSQKNSAFAERYLLVAALSKRFPGGLARHVDDGRTVLLRDVVYLDLPTGQVSWHLLSSQLPWFSHLKPYEGEWDGHDKRERYRRLQALQPDVQPLATEQPA